jgi:hypothetical protein
MELSVAYIVALPTWLTTEDAVSRGLCYHVPHTPVALTHAIYE